jgi:hypothetical protein
MRQTKNAQRKNPDRENGGVAGAATEMPSLLNNPTILFNRTRPPQYAHTMAVVPLMPTDPKQSSAAPSLGRNKVNYLILFPFLHEFEHPL